MFYYVAESFLREELPNFFFFRNSPSIQVSACNRDTQQKFNVAFL